MRRYKDQLEAELAVELARWADVEIVQDAPPIVPWEALTLRFGGLRFLGLVAPTSDGGWIGLLYDHRGLPVPGVELFEVTDAEAARETLQGAVRDYLDGLAGALENTGRLRDPSLD